MTPTSNIVSDSHSSATPTNESGLILSRDARLVSSMGPLLPGDMVTRIYPPLLSGNLWVDWQKIEGTDCPRPTIGAPEHSFVLQAYFPPHTVRGPPSTAVYTISPGDLTPSTRVSHKTDCVLRHDLDMKGSQITVADPERKTRRGMSHREDIRDTAYATIASKTMAMRVALPLGKHEFRVTLDPTQTGRRSMRGVTLSRDGKSVCAEEEIEHVYYTFKDGKVVELDSDVDEASASEKELSIIEQLKHRII